MSYTYSKALDNVGEFFFSSPIDNFNIWQDYGRSDDDQRHRFVFDGTIHSPDEAGKSLWERISHGFQLGTMIQYYSALPFNITAGTTTIQGTDGAADRQWRIHQPQRREQASTSSTSMPDSAERFRRRRACAWKRCSKRSICSIM